MRLNSLRQKLIILFDEANAIFVKKNYMNIENNTSERNLCALLGECISKLLLKYGLSNYFVDVEYNRNGDDLKSTMSEDEIFCDLILHSRGTLQNDNLIAVEMKKTYASQSEIEDDRTRLEELTCIQNSGGYYCRNGLIFPRRVCGYKIGILYLLNPWEKKFTLEFYAYGRYIHKVSHNIETKSFYGIGDYYPSNWFNFYPVGHGLFYAGILNPIDFSFVYDCGTMKSGVEIRRLIDHLAAYCPHQYLDFLAISHLHRDHVSGVPYLTSILPPKRVFLPYISGNFVVRIGIASAIMSFTMNVQEMMPIINLYRENLETQWEEVESKNNEKTMRFILKDDYWQFVFLTKSISSAKEEEFLDKVNDLLEKKGLKRIEDLINEEYIGDLKECYVSVFGGNRLNETSLVMLHYPLIPFYHTCVLSPYPGTSGTTIKYVPPVSLLTGDAIIDGQMAFTIYSYVKNKAGIIQIPHHGSYTNWNALNTNLLRTCAIYLVPKREKDITKSYLKTLNELSNLDYYTVTEKGGYMYWINIY